MSVRVWPSISCEKLHIELCVLRSRTDSILCVFQGLFHPARKVRDVYWKIYNSLYIGGQDTLVAGYPRIHNDPKNQFIRYELDYVI